MVTADRNSWIKLSVRNDASTVEDGKYNRGERPLQNAQSRIFFPTNTSLNSLWKTQPTSAYTDMHIYCIINRADSYMFRTPIVAVFKVVFLEGYIA